MLNNSNKQVEVTFSNYNNAFNYFFGKYKALCIKISSEKNIFSVNKDISCFIHDFDYAIPSDETRIKFSNNIISLNRSIAENQQIKQIITSDNISFAQEVEYLKIYYDYFLKHLNLLGDFISNLSFSFMPHTTMQKKLIKFSNNQPFFDTFTEFKDKVVNKISEFKITDFINGFNPMLTFYYAYSLFINENTKEIIDKILSMILSLMLHKDNLSILKKMPHISKAESIYIKNTERVIYENLLLCNSEINRSFSNYGILPKIDKKIYIDRTLM